MAGQELERTDESDASTCQTRCQDTTGCSFFSFWPDGGCHLQDDTAVRSEDLGEHGLETAPTSGPQSCGTDSMYPSLPPHLMLLGTPGLVTTGARTRTDTNNANTANGVTLQGGLFCVADAPAWSVNGVAFRMDGPDVSITIKNSYFTACKGNVTLHPAPHLSAPLTRGALWNHLLSASHVVVAPLGWSSTVGP